MNRQTEAVNEIQERCTFHDDHDPVTDRPRGNRCERPAIEEILWVDGRTSVACGNHGIEFLDEDARALVAEVRPLDEQAWAGCGVSGEIVPHSRPLPRFGQCRRYLGRPEIRRVSGRMWRSV